MFLCSSCVMSSLIKSPPNLVQPIEPDTQNPFLIKYILSLYILSLSQFIQPILTILYGFNNNIFFIDFFSTSTSHYFRFGIILSFLIFLFALNLVTSAIISNFNNITETRLREKTAFSCRNRQRPRAAARADPDGWTDRRR